MDERENASVILGAASGPCVCVCVCVCVRVCVHGYIVENMHVSIVKTNNF